jgi:hypothetical protein
VQSTLLEPGICRSVATPSACARAGGRALVWFKVSVYTQYTLHSTVLYDRRG